MRKATVFTVLVTFMAVLGMAGLAFAANSVTLQSDKPITPKSACGQAGSISMVADNLTIIHEGDVIQFLLDDGATVCGNIDFYLELADEGEESDFANTLAPVQATGGVNDLFDVTFAGTDFGPGIALTDAGSVYSVGFRVQASDGSRFINMTLARRHDNIGTVSVVSTANTTIQYVGNSAENLLTIKLFDGNDLAAYFFEPADRTNAPTVYDDDIADAGDEADNILCTNTLNFNSSLLHAIPDSNPTDNQFQINFLGDYIIQQLVSSQDFKIEAACKDDICQLVAINSGVDQAGNDIPATGNFDFGDYDTGSCSAVADRWTSTGYCTSTLIGNGLKIYKDGDTFDTGDQYRVTMTVRAGGSADATKALFTAAAPDQAFWTSDNEADNCDCDSAGLTTTAAASTAWVAYGGTNLNDLTAIRGTYTVADAQNTMNTILLDLANVQLDLDNVAAGEKVYIDVTFEKLPCGAVATETICIAELTSSCPTTAAVTIDGIAFIGDRSLTNVLHGYLGRLYGCSATSSITFPYAPGIDDAGFFTGMGISNTSTVAVNLSFALRDSAAGTATYAPTDSLAAGAMWVNTLDAISADLVDGTTPLDTTLPILVTVSAVSAE